MRNTLLQALDRAAAGPVAEGNVGGGTGMICHEFKCGIGTASRRVTIAGQPYTLGVLVQANYGMRDTLRIAGVPIGQHIRNDRIYTDVKPDTARDRFDHRGDRHRCAAAAAPAEANRTARRPRPRTHGQRRRQWLR